MLAKVIVHGSVTSLEKSLDFLVNWKVYTLLGKEVMAVEVKQTMLSDGLFIGKVAERAGVNPKTIRYYEEIGLLPKPQRGENRYRLYSKEAVELLQFIKKAQGLGFTLSEIKEIVAIRQMGHEPCVHVRALLERKIVDLDQRLKDLVAFQKKLKGLLAGWEEQVKRGRIKAIICPHIETVPLELKPRR